MSVTRDQLIEAAIGELDRRCNYAVARGHVDERDVAVVLSAVLPLVADAIDAQERLPYAIQRYVREADGALVRSLVDGDGQ